MTANAPHEEDATKFVEFLVSPQAQEVYADVNNEYPVVPGTEPSDLVASWAGSSGTT